MKNEEIKRMRCRVMFKLCGDSEGKEMVQGPLFLALLFFFTNCCTPGCLVHFLVTFL